MLNGNNLAYNLRRSKGLTIFALLPWLRFRPPSTTRPCKTSPTTSSRQISVLGHQANLKESSKSKELAEVRLQVLVVVITSDACESKKEIIRIRE
jgi:hypothetical protein